jgi:hypothetical protein
VGVSFDWCEIPGTAFDDWRRALAEAVGPLPDGVMISCKHVHDAPVMDPEAEYLLREVDWVWGLEGSGRCGLKG